MRSKRAFYNIISSLLLQFVVVICGFIIPKLIIKNYGSNVNGLINSISQFLSYITLLEAGFGPVVKSKLYKELKKSKDNVERILGTADFFFKRISFVFIIYIIILMIFYPSIVSKEFDYLFTFSLILIISFNIFSEYYFGMTYQIYLQSMQKNYICSSIQIISYIFNLLFTVVLIKSGCTIHLVKLMSCLVFIIRPIFLNVYVRKKYNIKINTKDSYVINNKWDGLAQHIAFVIHKGTDTFILTFFSTLSEVSVYSVYSFIVHGVKSILQSFTSGIDAIFGDILVNEENKMSEKFSLYEFFYNIVITIVYSVCIVLIIPFVKLYTSGINDANYIRPVFSILIVIGWYIWSFRQPYNLLIQSAGLFKETRRGAIIEALLNIIVSIILVFKLGIIGVAIGTIVAMLYRTIEFIFFCNRKLLKRSIVVGFINLIYSILQTLLVVFLIGFIPLLNYSSYFNWIINALIVVFISSIICLTFNFIINKNKMLSLLDIFLNLIKHKNHKKIH